MSEPICRWGIIGTAAIARKLWKAIRLSGNGHVVAVASRSASKARRFIDECESEVPMPGSVDAIGSYQELLDRTDIDTVYIPLPTGLRKQWVIAAAAAKKHVLCEKPAAIHATDAKEMIDACASAEVQFMDGVMFDHSARMLEIEESMDRSDLGKLRRVQTHFSFRSDESFARTNIRANADLEPHGCLGDLGWYCIRFTLRVCGSQMPTSVSARTLSSIRSDQDDREVPGEFFAEMTFDGGLTAGFYCSFLSSNQQTAYLSGDDGYLSVEDFVLPFYGAESGWTSHRHQLEIDNCRWNFGRHSKTMAVSEYAAGELNAQEVQMVRKMANCVIEKRLLTMHPKLTLQTQLILDACRRSDANGGEAVSTTKL